MVYPENTECLERVMYVRSEMADRVSKTRARDWIHLETLDDKSMCSKCLTSGIHAPRTTLMYRNSVNIEGLCNSCHRSIFYLQVFRLMAAFDLQQQDLLKSI
jgi:hypothetical protein